MIIPNLTAEFEKLGFAFTMTSRAIIKDRKHNLFISAGLEEGAPDCRNGQCLAMSD
jgi:hypothetical protein